jgi:hypothetical protein
MFSNDAISQNSFRITEVVKLFYLDNNREFSSVFEGDLHQDYPLVIIRGDTINK